MIIKNHLSFRERERGRKSKRNNGQEKITFPLDPRLRALVNIVVVGRRQNRSTSLSFLHLSPSISRIKSRLEAAKGGDRMAVRKWERIKREKEGRKEESTGVTRKKRNKKKKERVISIDSPNIEELFSHLPLHAVALPPILQSAAGIRVEGLWKLFVETWKWQRSGDWTLPLKKILPSSLLSKLSHRSILNIFYLHR